MRNVIKATLDGFANRFNPSLQSNENALVLTGGGARAAYQAGVLQYIAEVFPEAQFPILTGVSAGSVNAALLANHSGTFPECVGNLVSWWGQLRTKDVMEPTSSFGFVRRMVRRGGREEIGEALPRQGMVDTTPLRVYLQDKLRTENGELSGITANVREGRLKAFAVFATNYGTGQTVTWVQGRNIQEWERPNRIGVNTTITVDHIMASMALPFLFPAVNIGDAWYGDGGVRLSHPLSPAIYLGASRILAITTRYDRSRSEADVPSVYGYPPAAQIFGLLMNAVFLDTLDQDILTLERLNRLVDQLPRRHRMGLRPIRLLVMRPSVDLGKLAGEHEADLTGVIRLLARGLGSADTESPDWLSMLLLVPKYTRHLIEIGHRDAARQHERIANFLAE
ncbi:MAG: patatin-like phospholipase family protein [Candidatus Tectomicrobia bacterium]|nr:patatin-like phospholipase family protein [Candidatus Tectomicrobia bacterium]